LHEALFPALTDAYPAAFPEDVYTLDAMRWAGGVLASYSVQLRIPTVGGGVTAIVPLVEAAPRHRVDGSCFHEYDFGTDSYVLRTLRQL